MSANDIISVVVAKLQAKRQVYKSDIPNQDFTFGYNCAIDDAILLLEAYYDREPSDPSRKD